MAEATGLRNNALPYPIYGAPWGIVFPMLDADGDLVTGASTPDAEVSKNGDTFADCTNESTEIATSSGMYYLLLTATEMTADVVAVIAKSATAGMKTTPIVLYPRKLVTIRSNTSASGGVSTSTIVLDASASAIDDFYNGMICIATIDSNVEVRVISDYTGSTQTATVSPDWNVAPDNNDTFVIKLPEGVQLNQANATHWNHLATVALPLIPTTAGRTLDVSAGGEAGVDWANVGSPTTSLALTGTTIATTQKVDVETIKTNPVVNGGTITFPTGATLASTTNITGGTITTATNVTTVNGLAAGVITAAAVATGAIDADALAADAAAEIADAVWDEDATGHQTGGTFGQAIGDPAANTQTIYQAVITDAAGNNIAEDIIAIEAQTDDIGAAGAGLTAIPWNAAWDAEVQSEVNDELVLQNLDHLVKIAVDTNFATTVHADSVIGQLADNGAGYDRTTDSLEAIRDRGDAAWTGGGSAPTAAEVADAVWDEATSGHTTSGTFGEQCKTDIDDILVDTAVIGALGAGLTAVPWNAAWDAEVQSEVADALEETIADSVPADGTRPSVKQALYIITQFLLERDVTNTTLTVKKADGSTTLITCTLNSASAPTSITRAT